MIEDEKIREEIKQELSSYASGNRLPSLQDALLECDVIVVRSIAGAFGLSSFGDKIGGNVTTIHNFQEGITATDSDYQKFLEYKKGYSSSEIRPLYDKRQKLERDKIIKSDAPIFSGYTGKELPHNGQAQLEHIVSVSEIESMPENFLFMGQDDRINLAYEDKNLTMLEASINQSKSDMPLEKWLKHTASGQTEINQDRFDIDVDKATQLDRDARAKIKEIQRRKGIHKQAPEIVMSGLKQGALLGAREVLAMILIDFYDEAVVCIKEIIEKQKRGELTWAEIPGVLKISLCNVKDAIVEEYKDLIGVFFTGFGSGFISNFLMFVINNFVTTTKHIAMIAREAVYAFARVIQIACADEVESKSEQIAEVLLSSLSICLTVLLGEAIKQYLKALPFNDEISTTVSAMVVGIATVLITHYIASLHAAQLATSAAIAKTSLAAVELAEATEKSQNYRKQKFDQVKNSGNRLAKLKF